MTDKQIIDEERMFECVWCKYDFKESESNFILSENPNECVCSGCITEWADNLLYDLKRKEQECEFSNLRIIQLQETLSQYETDLSTKDCIVETCKAQYKELKSENDNIKETFDGLFKVQYKLADNNKKLRQCLTEIKEIAEPIEQNTCFGLYCGAVKQILQKISEVEDEN